MGTQRQFEIQDFTWELQQGKYGYCWYCDERIDREKLVIKKKPLFLMCVNNGKCIWKTCFHRSLTNKLDNFEGKAPKPFYRCDTLIFALLNFMLGTHVKPCGTLVYNMNHCCDEMEKLKGLLQQKDYKYLYTELQKHARDPCQKLQKFLNEKATKGHKDYKDKDGWAIERFMYNQSVPIDKIKSKLGYIRGWATKIENKLQTCKHMFDVRALEEIEENLEKEFNKIEQHEQRPSSDEVSLPSPMPDAPRFDLESQIEESLNQNANEMQSSPDLESCEASPEEETDFEPAIATLNAAGGPQNPRKRRRQGGYTANAVRNLGGETSDSSHLNLETVEDFWRGSLLDSPCPLGGERMEAFASLAEGSIVMTIQITVKDKEILNFAPQFQTGFREMKEKVANRLIAPNLESPDTTFEVDHRKIDVFSRDQKLCVQIRILKYLKQGADTFQDIHLEDKDVIDVERTKEGIRTLIKAALIQSANLPSEDEILDTFGLFDDIDDIEYLQDDIYTIMTKTALQNKIGYKSFADLLYRVLIDSKHANDADVWERLGTAASRLRNTKRSPTNVEDEQAHLLLATRAVEVMHNNQNANLEETQKFLCGASQVLAFLSLWEGMHENIACRKALLTYKSVLQLAQEEAFESRRYVIVTNIIDVVYHWVDKETKMKTVKKLMKKSKLSPIILNYLKMFISDTESLPLPPTTINHLQNAYSILTSTMAPNSRKLTRFDSKLNEYTRGKKIPKVNTFKELLEE
eukprot:m.336687 g.336687  ORF g.336687 m.336687 type:complete len:747 (-) comp17929_c0_seq1:27-2267(-)